MHLPVPPVFCALVLGFQVSSQAATVWFDDYTGQTAGAAPNMNFPGGAAGNDYSLQTGTGASFLVNGSIGNSAPALSLVDTSTTVQTILTTTMNHFAPFDVSPSSATPVLRVSFDLRLDSFLTGADSAQNVRFIFRATDQIVQGKQMVIGFSYANLNDGDAGTQDLTLFADTQTGNTSTLTPKDSTAIGLNAGVGWQPGFDFGEFNAGDASANDTNDEFYRVSFDYDSISGGISGSVTRLSNGATVSLPPGLSLTPGTVFNNRSGTPNPDRFLIASTAIVTTTAYFDNLTFETVPEPTAALLLGSGFVMFGMRRRRA